MTASNNESEANKITVLAEQAGEWVSSEVGIKAQEEAIQQSTEVLNKLRKDQRVDLKVLFEPIIR